MSEALNRVRIGEGIHFSHIPDPKFKRNLISINFITPLDEAHAADNAVIPFILRKGCRECPDFSTLNARLNELYGATLSAGISKVNCWQIIGVSILALDDRFALENEDISGACASLLAAVALDPKPGPDGFFASTDVELEKQYLIDTIESEINDKRSYAIMRCMQEMCAGEPVSVRRYGTLESAGRITPRSAYEAYRNLLESAGIEISFSGCGDPSAARRVFTEAFTDIPRGAEGFSLLPLRQKVAEVKERTENMALSQAKLVMGFRCAGLAGQEEIDAMRLCSALLGGTPFSKLFLNVRERLSLCYYCASNFDQYNKILIVDSGIEAKNNMQTREEILRQLAAIQSGDFTDEELADTKRLISNSITRNTDSPSAMESWYLYQIIKHAAASPREEAARLNEVTREQIIAASQGVALDTVYFLSGNEEGEGE